VVAAPTLTPGRCIGLGVTLGRLSLHPCGYTRVPSIPFRSIVHAHALPASEGESIRQFAAGGQGHHSGDWQRPVKLLNAPFRHL